MFDATKDSGCAPLPNGRQTRHGSIRRFHHGRPADRGGQLGPTSKGNRKKIRCAPARDGPRTVVFFFSEGRIPTSAAEWKYVRRVPVQSYWPCYHSFLRLPTLLGFRRGRRYPMFFFFMGETLRSATGVRKWPVLSYMAPLPSVFPVWAQLPHVFFFFFHFESEFRRPATGWRGGHPG